MSNLIGRKIMVTAGGTREYLDDVRVLTNISSGALGAKITEELLKCGASVYYLQAKNSVWEPIQTPGEHSLSPTSRSTYSRHEFVTTNDLMKTMHKLIENFEIDTVIHSAAVSDFTFTNPGGVKLSSSSPQAFVEYIKKTITTTPKIISYIKKWKPEVTLVGFKFTVGKTFDELYKIAVEALKKNKSDLVVANDLAEMKKEGVHRAYLIHDNLKDAELVPAVRHILFENIRRDGKEEIAKGIASFLGSKS